MLLQVVLLLPLATAAGGEASGSGGEASGSGPAGQSVEAGVTWGTAIDKVFTVIEKVLLTILESHRRFHMFVALGHGGGAKEGASCQPPPGHLWHDH